MEINIFGVDYEIKEQTKNENPKLEGYSGLCENYSKEIFIVTGYENDKMTVNNVEDFKAAILRHEIFHAIFHECGLTDYNEDERLVEFLAQQYPKIEKIMQEAQQKFGMQ